MEFLCFYIVYNEPLGEIALRLKSTANDYKVELWNLDDTAQTDAAKRKLDERLVYVVKCLTVKAWKM